LRERLEDLPSLIEQLGPRLLRETGVGPLRLTAEALVRLRRYPWPGNVRELHAALARALLRSTGGMIQPHDLEPLDEPGTGLSLPTMPLPLERAMITAALDQARGSVTAAAARIGWSRQKLYRRLAALGISRSGAGITSSDSSTFQ
jgi:DNA-binding NtrC family response regulator